MTKEEKRLQVKAEESKAVFKTAVCDYWMAKYGTSSAALKQFEDVFSLIEITLQLTIQGENAIKNNDVKFFMNVSGAFAKIAELMV